MSHPRSDPGAPEIALSGVTFGYGSVSVLDQVSLTIEPGRIACVVGANGAGKTTLLKLILPR